MTHDTCKFQYISTIHNIIVLSLPCTRSAINNNFEANIWSCHLHHTYIHSFIQGYNKRGNFFYANQFISTSIHYFNFVSLDDVAIRHANAIQWMPKKDVTSDLTIKLLISFSTSPQFFTLEYLPLLHFIRAVFFSRRGLFWLSIKFMQLRVSGKIECW